jgi:NADPH2:quinone reductase
VRAIVVREAGGPGVLREEEVDAPVADPGEVLIRVAAATVNYADVKARSGRDGAPVFPYVPGHDVVGTVEAVGDGVTEFAVGQRVGTIVWHGGYAELTPAPVAQTVALPDAISFEQAASVVALATAYAAVVVLGRLQAGEAVVVNGASGGVGSIAVQIARHLGAQVVVGATRSAEKEEFVRELGARPLVTGYGSDYAEQIRAACGRDPDLIVDGVGGPAVEGGVRALAELGRFVTYGGTSGQEGSVPAALIQKRTLTVAGYRGRGYLAARPAVLMEAAAAAFELVVAGAVAVPVATMPLGDAARAHEIVESGQTRGKLLLVP